MNNYEFICPTCNTITIYTSLQAYKYALKNIKLCKSCKMNNKNKIHYRKCPSCEKIIKYKNKYCYTLATARNSICASCKQLGHKVSNESKVKMRNARISFYKNNPESKTILRNLYLGKTYEELHGVSESARIKSMQSMHSSGKNNFFYGKSSYTICIDKYGHDEGEKKWKEMCKIKSEKSRGENNPMYGKPAPQGSGNGWSGWYKRWYFRSLHELSYMVNVIERFNLPWKSMESKDTRISYIDWAGTNRTYFPDFLINNKYVVEVKPKKLWKSPSVISKAASAIEWCKVHNFVYKLRCIPMLQLHEVQMLRKSGHLKFTPKYEEKFEKYEHARNMEKILSI